jgi:PAS domain S-box-containing protein
MIARENEKQFKTLAYSSRPLPEESRANSSGKFGANNNSPFNLELTVGNLVSDFSFLKALVDNIPNPIFITQLDSSIKYVNPALERLTGYARSEVIGCKIPYPWWPLEMIELYRGQGVIGAKKDLNTLERTFKKKNGEQFWVNIKIQALKQGDGVQYYLGIWEDLTERKIAENKIRESEATYRNLFQSMAQGVIYFDDQGKVLSANPAACDILGVTMEQMRGQSIAKGIWSMFDENDAELTEQNLPISKALTTGLTIKNMIVKIRIPHDKEERWINVDAVPEFLPGRKEAYRVFATLRDITERKRGEYKHKEAAREWKNTFDSISDMVSIQDKECRLLKVNRAYAKILNKTPEELIGQFCYSKVDDSDCPVAGCPHQQTLRTGKSATSNYYEAKLDLHLEVSTSPIYDSKGEIAGCVHIARDISERKVMEDRLSRVQEFNSQILLQAPNPVMVIAADNSIQYVNPAFEHLTGFSEKEILGFKPPFPYWPKEKIDEYQLDYSNQDITHAEREFCKKNGQAFWVRLASAPVQENGLIKYHLVNWADISELKQINNTLVESESKFRVLAEQSPNLIFINKDGRVVYANQRCEELTGYSRQELTSPDFNFLTLIAPNYRDLIIQRYDRHVKGHEVEPLEYQVVAKGGGLISVLYNTRLIIYEGGPAVLGTIMDVSERKRAQEELQQREQLYKSLFENMLNGFAYCQMIYKDNQARDFVYLAVNKAFTAHTGLADVVGKKVSEVIPGILQSNPALIGAFGRVASAGMPERFEDYVPELDMWFSISVYSPQKGYFVAVFDAITERKRAQENLKNSYEKVKSALESSIDVAAKMVEMRDPYTAGHQQKVAQLSVAIATEMHLSDEQVAYLGLAAKVHDIGKIHVPAEILSKTGRLTNLEFQMMMTHAQGGYDVLNGVDFPWPLAQIILQHHERMDGSGYPNGLKGDQILLEARIIAVADTVEAMSGHRPYRPSLGMKEALEEIKENKGKLFDTRVVEACIDLVEKKEFHFED